MKKIYILFCGGTVSMKKNKKGLLSPFYKVEELLERFPQLKQIAKITIEQVINIDSSNMTAELWTEIAKRIKKRYTQYDGFVITHGTDTMAYTASALSFALSNLNKSIVLTGSQKTIDDVATDATNNLINSVLVACTGIPEICIVFGSKILKGNRATKISESSLDPFESPSGKLLGEISLNPKIFYSYNKKPEDSEFIFKPHFNKNVLCINLYPGMTSVFLDRLMELGIQGIILRAFGPGNIPFSIIPFLKKAKKLKIPVVILSQCYQGVTQMQLYDVGYKALKAGAIPGKDMTIEAATTKLMWALENCQDIDKIKKIFATNIAGEIS